MNTTERYMMSTCLSTWLSVFVYVSLAHSLYVLLLFFLSVGLSISYQVLSIGRFPFLSLSLRYCNPETISITVRPLQRSMRDNNTQRLLDLIHYIYIY